MTDILSLLLLSHMAGCSQPLPKLKDSPALAPLPPPPSITKLKRSVDTAVFAHEKASLFLRC